MAITIVGIPWARASFNSAAYTLFPFGFTAVDRSEFRGAHDPGTGDEDIRTVMHGHGGSRAACV